MLMDLSHYNHWWVYLFGEKSVIFSLSFGCDWYIGISVLEWFSLAL